MFELWMTIYMVGGLIVFAVAYRIFFVKKNATKSRKIFGSIALLGGVVCILDFISQVTGPTMLSISVQNLLGMVYPLIMFMLMLIPLMLYKRLGNKTVLVIMVLPAVAGLFAVIGHYIMGAEACVFGNITYVKFIYNEDIYSIWLFLNVLPIIAMYYFFYKVFKLHGVEVNEGLKKRLKVFVAAFTLIIISGFVFAIFEMILRTPPLSSVGAAFGISLAMTAFKMKKERI